MVNNPIRPVTGGGTNSNVSNAVVCPRPRFASERVKFAVHVPRAIDRRPPERARGSHVGLTPCPGAGDIRVG